MQTTLLVYCTVTVRAPTAPVQDHRQLTPPGWAPLGNQHDSGSTMSGWQKAVQTQHLVRADSEAEDGSIVQHH